MDLKIQSTLKETERKIIGADKMDEIVKFTILIKLNCLKTTLEKEDLAVLENIISYLRNVSTLQSDTRDMRFVLILWLKE